MLSIGPRTTDPEAREGKIRALVLSVIIHAVAIGLIIVLSTRVRLPAAPPHPGIAVGASEGGGADLGAPQSGIRTCLPMDDGTVAEPGATWISDEFRCRTAIRAVQRILNDSGRRLQAVRLLRVADGYLVETEEGSPGAGQRFLVDTAFQRATPARSVGRP